MSKQTKTEDPVRENPDSTLPDGREVLKILKPRQDEAPAVDGEPRPDDEAEKQPQTDAQKAMQALSDDDEEHVNWSFDAVLGGEILSSGWVRRQAGFFIMIIVMMFLYISNRYSAQKEMIRIDGLKTELNEVRNEATTRSSQLLQRSRESKVVEYLKNTADSALDIPTQPPFIISSDGE
jgi:hypothetical protein